MLVYAVDQPTLPPLEMPPRFKTEVTYFMTPPGDHGVPKLPPGEYWVRLDDARQWLEELVVEVVSPLDAEAKAELELTEEQEAWLEWMVDNGIERIRVE
jgi:hypothetical protein